MTTSALRPSFRYGFALAVFLGLFASLHFSIGWIPDYDGYFHIRYSQLLSQQGFIDKLPWLHFTIRADSFRDHHLLWHYLLIPFTGGDLILGGMIATTLFASLAGLACYALLREAKVRLPLAWTLCALLASHPFLFRMSLLRVQSVSLALLLAAVLLCLKKRLLLLSILSALFVWTYDGFTLLILIGVFFMIASRLTGEDGSDRCLIAILAGIAFGMVINPYFPDNIFSLFYNASRSILHNVPGIKLGNEWYPYDSWHLFTNSLPAWGALFAAILFLPFAGRINREEYACLLLNLFFLAMAMKSRRFIEYWPVFAVLSAGLVIGRRVNAKPLAIVFLLALPLLGNNYLKARAEIADSLPPQIYEGSAKWLAANSGDGEIVFHADWDDFPFLFFYNQKNRYILGMDPMYMYTKDPELYRLYQKITKGEIDQPAALIRERFDSRFIFLDRREHRDFYEKMKADTAARLAYEDDGGLVFEVMAEKAGGE